MMAGPRDIKAARVRVRVEVQVMDGVRGGTKGRREGINKGYYHIRKVFEIKSNRKRGGRVEQDDRMRPRQM